MAELLGTIASATQLVELGIKIAFLISDISRRLHKAPELLRKIDHQTKNAVLISKSIQTHCDALERQGRPALLDLKAHVDDSLGALDRIDLRLRSLVAISGDGKLKIAWKRIITLKNEKELQSLLKEVEQANSRLILWFSSEIL